MTADLCAAFQHAAFAHVEDRLDRALDYVHDYDIPITALVVAGGVAASTELRRRLLALLNARADSEGAALPLVFPPPALCTDNGVMAAWGAVEKLREGISDAVEGQEVLARWPLGADTTGEPPLVFRKIVSRRERERLAREQQGTRP